MTVDEYILWFKESAETLDPVIREEIFEAFNKNQLVNTAKQLHVIKDKYNLSGDWDEMLKNFFWAVY